MSTPSPAELAVTLLSDVSENWKSFWFNHGVVAKNLGELCAALDDMNADEFRYHVNGQRNDIAVWVDTVVGDATLAHKLRLLSTLEATRRMVGRRVDELTSLLPVAAPVEEAVEEVVVEAPVLEMAVATADAVSAPVATKKVAKKAKAKKVVAKAKTATKKTTPPPAPKKTSLLGRLLNR
jgi:hypothetical protein